MVSVYNETFTGTATSVQFEYPNRNFVITSNTSGLILITDVKVSISNVTAYNNSNDESYFTINIDSISCCPSGIENIGSYPRNMVESSASDYSRTVPANSTKTFSGPIIVAGRVRENDSNGKFNGGVYCDENKTIVMDLSVGNNSASFDDNSSFDWEVTLIGRRII